MKQKIFGAVLAALLAVCLLPAAAMAENQTNGTFGVDNKLTWELDKGVLTISGTGSMGIFYHGPVGPPWGISNNSITEVVIEEGVTDIGEGVFEFCNSLNSITIPSSVTSIGYFAFNYCPNLKSVTFEGNSKLKNIGAYAFYICTNLESITIPSSVTSIGAYAFDGTPWQKNLAQENKGFAVVNSILLAYTEENENVKIPEGVTQIVGAFNRNKKLESVTIPESVTSIGESAFESCTNLKNITIPNSVTSIDGIAFYDCTKLKSVTFEGNSKLKSIEAYAFQECTSLESITIPNSVERVGDCAFEGCDSLKIVRFQGKKAPLLPWGASPFIDPSPISIIVIPPNAEQSYEEEGWPHKKNGWPDVTYKTGYPAGVSTIGGGKATISTDFPYVDEPVTLTATPDAGCYFVEWRTDSPDVVVSGNSFEMPNHDVTVTAVFAEYSSDPFFYVLNFETNGGSEIKTFTSEDVVTVNLADYKPTKEGYTFTGWYSDRDLTKKITSVRLNADRTVYAGWEEVKPEPEPEPTCKRDNTCPAAQFADLDLNVWYHDGIHYCLAKGLMNGVETAKFAPNAPTNRAMIATILWRMEEKPSIDYTLNFTDVNAESWYGEAVRWAAGEGIINGYEDSTFKPDSNITREELAAVLYRYAEYKKADITANTADLTKFADNAKVSAWAEDAMKWAVACNIINGDEQNLLNPQGSATRAEVAAMLARLAEGIAK